MSDERVKLIIDNIGQRFIGKENIIQDIVVALLAGGHVLIEDVPGVGKTTLAEALAASVNCSFSRIQFTPDTLPSDITGVSVYRSDIGQFQFMQGPVFSQIILADEINRTSPKTQAALLEAMEEGQVSIDGRTYLLANPFMVIATQNPSEHIGTYQLPEAQLDRFLMKISVGYPDRTRRDELARAFLEGRFESDLGAVLSAEDILSMAAEVKAVTISDELMDFALDIVDGTRSLQELEYGASPRAGLDLLKASRALAYVLGRDFVIPEDVERMALRTIPHRLVLTTEAHMSRITGEALVKKVLETMDRPR